MITSRSLSVRITQARALVEFEVPSVFSTLGTDDWCHSKIMK